MTEAAQTPADHDDGDRGDSETVHVRESEVTVNVERSVRFNRLLIVGLVLGAAVGALLAVTFPVGPDADYTLAQAVGFSAVLGAAGGLVLGGLLGITLNLVARRKRGTGVAVQTDVR
ncbi:MAG: hypothetical protein ACTHZM_07935 [Canibacter sp.]